MACGGDLPDAAIVLGAIAVVRGVALGYVPAALIVGELALAAAGILCRRVNLTGERDNGSTGYNHNPPVQKNPRMSGAVRWLLLCGADRMGSVVNPEDRATAVLFGDGAGTVLIEPVDATPTRSLEKHGFDSPTCYARR